MKRFIYLIILVVISTTMIKSSGGCKKQNNASVILDKEVVTTFAGGGTGVSTTLPGAPASFNNPTGVAVDDAGNVYVADQGNNLIRKISPSGAVTILAGSGQQGSTNGTGSAASFKQPTGVAVDIAGNVYVADAGNNLIREISPSGVVKLLVGDGFVDSIPGFPGGPPPNIGDYFYGGPLGVALDKAGNVYVADTGSARNGNASVIQEIFTGSGVVVEYFAGGGGKGSVNGTAYNASFFNPTGVTVDGAGNVYVADAGNNLIRKIVPAGPGANFLGQAVVTTLAGNGTQGSYDGEPMAASFNSPQGVAVDAAGNVYVADTYNNKIRKISSSGVVTTLAGNGNGGLTNGTSYASTFYHPTGVAVDVEGNVYVADAGNNVIRKITQ